MSYQPLSFREKLCYGSGDFASCLFWASFSNFLFLFYTDVFGISALSVGTLLLVSRIWDGVNDPIMGIIADRTRTRWGKFRPYLLWIAVPYAVVGMLVFTTPDFGMTGKLIWAYVTYNAMMMLYTAINIPYTALLGVITPDSVERTRVASFKFIFANAAYIVIQAVLLLMVKALGGENAQRGWQWSFAIVGVVAVVFFLFTFLGTRERVTPPLHQKTSVKRDLGDLAHNRPWFFLVAITIMFVLFVATYSTVGAHYLKYFVGAQEYRLPWAKAPRLYSYEQIISVVLTIGSVGSLVGVVCVGPIVARVGKKTAFVGAFLMAATCSVLFYTVKPNQLFTIAALQFLRSLAGGPLAVILWSMYADAADYSEWKTGRRATGLVFSASTMTQKFCWAMAGVLVGWMLDATGFVPNVAQTARVQNGLTLLMSVVPASFGLIAVMIVYFYPLNEKRMREIQTGLQDRRAAPTETSLPAL